MNYAEIREWVMLPSWGFLLISRQALVNPYCGSVFRAASLPSYRGASTRGQSSGILFVELSPVPEGKRRWRGLWREEAILKTGFLARSVLYRAPGTYLYAREAFRATFGIHPTPTRLVSA